MLNFFQSTEYQVVLEFHDDAPTDFERVLALETKLEEQLKSGEIDGNDVGQGVVNIFILTKSPKHCFEEAMEIIIGAGSMLRAAGYRDRERDDYVRLWPDSDSTPFELK